MVIPAMLLLFGCATSEEVKLRMRVQELEQALAGAQDDAGMLMRYAFEQDQYVRQLENGAMWQAGEMARIRETCEF